jgi:hypothetical protein
MLSLYISLQESFQQLATVFIQSFDIVNQKRHAVPVGDKQGGVSKAADMVFRFE